MLESSKIALKFPENWLPPLMPNEAETRVLIALHIEKNVFCDNKVGKFKIKSKEVFNDFAITSELQRKKFLTLLDKYNNFLKILIIHMREREKIKDKALGTFTYDDKKDFIYYDEDDGNWCVDLEKLQNRQAKYDNIDLYTGQVIIIFNSEAIGKPITVRTDKIEIPENNDNSTIQQLLSNMQLMGHQIQNCTCKQVPCTCGAVTPPQPVKEDDKYLEWANIMGAALDRDVILVYQDGELKMRF